MRSKGMTWCVACGTAAVLALGLASPPAALAVDNLYTQATGGLWTEAGHWSLGHVPTVTETPVITAGSTANKIVSYNLGTGISYPSVRVDGHSSGYYGMILQTQNVLTTTDLCLGTNGAGWYWLESPAYTWVDGNLYVGYQGSGSGNFYMCTGGDYSSGLYVGDICYVGYGCAGDFDHSCGIAQVARLYVGQSSPGYYHMRGGRLEIATQFVLGNGDEGTFEQTNGTVDQAGTNGLIMGLNTGGEGTYLMKGGTLDIDHISIAWNGDGYFTQSGGTVTTVGDINIGCQGTHPMQAWYKLNQDNGTAVLNVGGDLLVGVQTYGKYEQNAGTCNVTGNVEIWKGSTTSTSAVYLNPSAGLLDVDGEVINHTGYYSQIGGVMTTSDFTNDSTQGVYLGSTGDFRATNLDHNAGTFQMYGTSKLRGQLAIPPSTFFACSFTNGATFQMGTGASPGGTFGGHLTNNGTFNYYQGDFTSSTLTNYGTVNFNGDFACRRLVNHANITVPTSRTIAASGTGYANAVENNGNFTMAPSSEVDVGSSVFVNNGAMYAGGPGSTYAHIVGDLENDDYLLPSQSSLPTGRLYVEGDFTQVTGAELRIRLRGTGTDYYDRLNILGVANLAGELDVRLTEGFVPALGNTFDIITYGSRSGMFNPILLPALPAGRAWQTTYLSTGVRLTVIPDAQWCLGDMNCSGGSPTFEDIKYFSAAVGSESSWWAYYRSQNGGASPTCPWLLGDYNTPKNGVEFNDIKPFAASIGQPCIVYVP